MIFQLFLLCAIFISSSLTAQAPLILGIAGGTGSGKSTFAKKIKETFGDDVALIQEDAYYKDLTHLSLEERKQVNFDHPDSLDFDLFCQHLDDLKQGKAILKPTYDFNHHLRTTEMEEVLPAKIIIAEGVLLFAVAEVRERCDIKLFIDVEDDIRFIRRLERDLLERGRTIEDVKRQYFSSVKPMHNLFVGPSKIHADIIIPGIGDTREAEKIIEFRLKGQG